MSTTTSPIFTDLRRQRGITMIEVLVTIIVLAIGLLGLAGLQLNSLQFTHSAYQNSQATIMANDIIDRMRANRINAESGNYSTAFSDRPSDNECRSGTITGTIAAIDLFEWKCHLQDTLPLGEGEITRSGNTFTVTVRWDDTRGEQAPKSLTMEALL